MSKVKCQRSNVASQGFGLVEIIVAMGIFAIIATAGVTTVLNGFVVSRLGEEETFANLYAKEGIEAARSIRNQNWANLTAGNHGVSKSGGNWVFSGTSDPNGKYTRVVRIDQIQRIDTFCNLDIIPTGGIVDQDTFKATSTVTWAFSSGRTNNVELVTYLTNFKQTSQGGSTQGGGVNMPGDRNGLKIQVQGNYAYIVRDGGTPDFVIVDISNPCALVDVGSLDLSDRPENIAVSGNYAYIASRSNSQELQIIDISNPASPFVVAGGTYNALGNENALGIYYDSNKVYLVREDSADREFFIIDVTSPSSPTFLGSAELGNFSREVVVLGSYAYVASGHDSQELQVVNVSNPSSPSLVASLNLLGTEDARTIAGFASTIVLGRLSAGSSGNLHTIDVTTPTLPNLLDSYDASGNINDIAIGRNNTEAFLATSWNSGEYQQFDISPPSNIFRISTLNIAATLNGIAYHSGQDLVFAVGNSDTQELIVIQPSSSQYGISLKFDGNDDFARSVNLPLLTTFTVEAYVKRINDRARDETFLSDAQSTSEMMFTLFVDGDSNECGGGTDEFAFWNGSSIQCSGVTAQLNRWYHIAVSRDASGNRRYFVDGVLRNTQTGTPVPTDSSGRLHLGRRGENTSERFDGLIDEVRIQNSAIYTSNFTPPITPLSSDAGTEILYHLDEGDGQVINDSSSYGRNGTLGPTTSVEGSDPVWTADSKIPVP